ncbi:diaminobutyrate acetyltransferase [Bordetella genomosp. 9]|uniref:L-2,4-diaminobutyric acid acetyltransferase n=1 Tax=Bordetella genomosp. 9 TaxID=1416803 RepID=A0A261REM5_9BORD|nr:diaminobutyrate acetyltransferase [Bordetella genomosp. 9]OZI23498.1 diaminobutyrate acetyltransferase [Bordetella genomosp. 9]
MSQAVITRAADTLAAQDLSHLFRTPRVADGAAIHALVAACPPLDLNTVYAYLLLCEHFAQTCVVAESPDGGIDGFVSAYVPPGQSQRLFIWQVAVHERARGERLARRMLHALLRRPALAGIRHLETTVGPDNHASRRTFTRLAADLGAPVAEQPFFDRQLFGQAEHDDEMLIRIGPMACVPR